MASEKDTLEQDIDALFKMPLNQFTAARNALAARTSKSGNPSDAAAIKALSKPSISAWAANQLYWRHRADFNRLIAAGESISKLHAAQAPPRSPEMQKANAAKREAITILTRLAADLLRHSGHNPTPEILRRIQTTLETQSVASALSTSPPPGRLTEDLAPLGFDGLAALIPSGSELHSDSRSRNASSDHDQQRGGPARGTKADKRQSNIEFARALLNSAEQNVQAVRKQSKKAAAALEEAAAELTAREEAVRRAEEHLAKARDEVSAARDRLRFARMESEKAKEELLDAERSSDKARRDLEDQEVD